jgi:putative spermidine/putrescine transport system ATP-binding protein
VAEPALRLAGIAKHYGATAAVAGIELTVSEGELVTLLGPSGCGKTTTLGLIAGFFPPTAGEIYLKGKPVSELPSFRRDIGVVFQDYALFPHMTAAENVAFGLKMRKVASSEIARRVKDALDLVKLDGLGERRPLAMSGGQRQRVALARALVVNPAVLLLDEPLSNLDLKLREEMRVEIVAIQRRLGITTIFVTHDQGEALVMSDRIAVMNAGRIEQVGDPAAIYEAPATRFVAEFIGRMNLFAGEVTAGRAVRLRAGPVVAIDVPADVAEGAAVHVAVRPERARLLRTQPAEDLALAGTVRQVLYLGASREVRLDLAGGERGVVEIANDGMHEAFDAGASVWLCASLANCRVLAAQAGGR